MSIVLLQFPASEYEQELLQLRDATPAAVVKRLKSHQSIYDG
jgi:hypothetical protein